MTLFQSVYCYGYQSALDNSDGVAPEQVRKTGTTMAAIILLMWFLSVAYLIFVFDWADPIVDALQDLFGRKAGKQLGQFIGLFFFLLIYPLVYLRWGTPTRFAQTISAYEELPPEKRSETATRGFVLLAVSIGVFVVSIVVGMVGSFLLQ